MNPLSFGGDFPTRVVLRNDGSHTIETMVEDMIQSTIGRHEIIFHSCDLTTPKLDDSPLRWVMLNADLLPIFPDIHMITAWRFSDSESITLRLKNGARIELLPASRQIAWAMGELKGWDKIEAGAEA